MGYIATRTQENFTFLASDLWRKQLHQLSSVKCDVARNSVES